MSTAAAHDAILDRSVDVAAALGVPEEAALLGLRRWRERCRSPMFRRGVYYRDGATVQPARLVRAVRRTALASGVRLYERTAASRVSSTASRRRAAGAGGGRRRRDQRLERGLGATRSARDPLRKLRRADRGKARPRRGDRLDGRRGDHRLPDVPALLPDDRGRPRADGLRFGPIGFGGRIDDRFTSDRGTGARAEAGLRALLPGLVGARVEDAWGGPIDVSADHLPVLRHRARHASPLRRRLHGKRRRPELARRPDPCLTRTRARRRVDAAAARRQADQKAAARADQLPRRKPRAEGDAFGRGGRDGGPARAGLRGSSPRFRAASACASARA